MFGVYQFQVIILRSSDVVCRTSITLLTGTSQQVEILKNLK